MIFPYIGKMPTAGVVSRSGPPSHRRLFTAMVCQNSNGFVTKLVRGGATSWLSLEALDAVR